MHDEIMPGACGFSGAGAMVELGALDDGAEVVMVSVLVGPVCVPLPLPLVKSATTGTASSGRE